MSWFRRLFHRARADAELDAEIRFYLDQETQLRIDRGESPERARHAARRDFGNVTLVKEITRETWGRTRVVERLWDSARWAARSCLKTPGLTATIIVTFALGVGASLASFSLVNTLLLRPMGGVVRPGELVRIAAAGEGQILLPVTSMMRESLRHLPAFAGVCGVNTPGAVVTIAGRAAYEGLLHFSGDCFDVLGVNPRLGRLLTAEDDRVGAPVAVITDDFWRRALGEAPDVLGRIIDVDGAAFTIVGVTEPAFRGLSTAFPSSVAIPANAVRRGLPTIYWCEAIARRARGVSLAQARVQVETDWPRLKEAAGLTAKTSAVTRARFEASRAFVGEMSTGIENALRPTFERPLILTFGLSVLMLVICGANVANLLATRALTRRREHAMRLALGATRGDLWWQSAIEAAIPVVAGAVVAVPIAHVITVTLVDVLRSRYLPLEPAGPWDLRVSLFLAAAVGLMTLTGWLVTIASRRRVESPADALRASGRTAGDGYGRTRRLLVAAQIALTVMLVGSAGTFVRTLQQFYAVDPGFSVDSALAALLVPLPGGAEPAALGAHFGDLLARVEALPGVRSASVTTWMPLGAAFTEDVRRIPETTTTPVSAATWTVSDRFFESMGVPLSEGRTFARADASAARTTILSRSLAARLFPDSSAIGGRVSVGPDPQKQNLIVIGVAADARLGKPQATPLPVIYLNYWDDPQRAPFLLVRADDDRPERLSDAVTTAVRAGGREFPLWTRTISAQWHVALMQERLLAGTSVAFGAVGLLIAAVGLFGLLSHYVTRRHADIGIRLAVGAGARDITRLLIGEVAGLFVLGCVSGTVLLLVTSRSLASLLVGTAPADFWLVSLTLGIVGLVALPALWLPLRRATSIDPLVALRSE